MPMDLALLTLLFLTASVCFVFYFFSSSEVGGPQISFANPEICGLKKFVIFADLPPVWRFGVLRFADPIFFAICRPNFLRT
jgi:hypothetical protein